MTNLDVMTLTIHSTNIFAVTFGGDVWKRSISDILGIKGTMNEKSNIKLYPNPNCGVFMINSNSALSSIEVYSLTGELLYSNYNLIRQTSTEINLSYLQKGIYFVRINDGKQVLTEKIILH